MQTLEVEANFMKAKNFPSPIKFSVCIDIHGESESILLLPCPTIFVQIVPSLMSSSGFTNCTLSYIIAFGACYIQPNYRKS